MDAAAGHLAARPQAWESRGAVEVGQQASREVVRGRGDRQPVGAGIETDRADRCGDGRKPLVEVLERSGVEPQVVDALFEHAGRHGPADDVARRQFLHEAPALGIAQQRAMTAQRLGEQRAGHGRMVQRRRVELHELDIGDRHAATQGHGDAVPARRRRIGGHRVQLSRSPTGQHDMRSPHLVRAAARVQRHHALAATALHEEVDGEPPLEQGGGRLPHGLDQRTLDLGAGGGAAGVDDAGGRVAALAGEGEAAPGVRVEHRSQGDELLHPAGSLADEDLDRVHVAQPGAGGQSVSQVEVRRVLVDTQHGGHAALGPAGGRLGQLGLGHQADPEARAPRGPHRGRKPRHPAPDDEDVERRRTARREAGVRHYRAAGWSPRDGNSSSTRLRASTCTTRGSKPSSSASS